ncbi:MAG: HVO_2072 family ArtA-dependent S-layer glycoprotein, partial [Haloarculaceae archaeon]
MTVAFSGAAAAASADRGDDTGNWDTAIGGGNVSSGAVIYQGEDNITFWNTGTTSEVSPANLERTAGSAEGETLQMPIPDDADTGKYAIDGNASNFNVTVQSPRVTTLEVQNNEGADVAGGLLRTDQNDSQVYIEYNYDNAENIELTVEDESGLDVTGEIVTAGATNDSDFDGIATIPIDPGSLDSGDYTFTVEGVEDISGGDATESTTVTITDDQTASLSVDSDEITQGENLGYTVDNSNEDNLHAVYIESDEFRENVDVENYIDIFRNTGDAVETGVYESGNSRVNASNISASDADGLEYAYAVVEIDGGQATADIETQWLDDTNVDLSLVEANITGNYLNGTATNGSLHDNNANLVDAFGDDLDDDTDFDVVEGTVAIDNPTGAYVVNSEITVSGTADEGIEDVAFYARDNANFELVTIDGERTVDVAGDNTFEEEDISLSAGPQQGDEILSFPGTYRFGVIDAQDADLDSDGTLNVENDLDTSEFNSGVSSTVGLRVVDTALEGEFVTYGGEIADEDTGVGLDVSGTAVGMSDTGIVAVFVGERGNVQSHEISVDEENGTFEEEELALDTLSQGVASAHLLSSARDGHWGANTGGGGDLSALNSYLTSTNLNAGNSPAGGDQVRSRIVGSTIDDTGSDDLMVTQNFRITDARTSVEALYPEASPDADTVESGETMVAEGTTNRLPQESVITVEILNQDEESETLTSTEEWGTDGQWSVTLDTTDIEPGTYVVEADDGTSTDRQEFEIVAQRSTPTPEPTPEPTP